MAASKFDPSRGYRVISCAKWWVKCTMLRAITDGYTSGRYRRSDARLRGAVRREGPSSMGEIGKSYNFTEKRIRQIEGSAIKKMKYPLLKGTAFDFVSP